MPAAFALRQNYPNPFNPATTVVYAVPSRSRVTIEVFNLLGQRMAVLVDDVRADGTYEAVWAAGVPSGVCFCRMETVPLESPENVFSQVRKMILTR